MPEQRGLSDWAKSPTSGLYSRELREPDKYQRMPGIHIYEAMYISSLNRIPIEEVTDYVCDDTVLTWGKRPPPGIANLGKPIEWSIQELITRRTVQGGTVVQDTIDEGLVFLEGLLCVEKELVRQRLSPCQHDEFGRPIDFYETKGNGTAVREMRPASLTDWSVEDYYESADGKREPLEAKDYEKLMLEPMPATIPASSLHVYPWGLGILEPAGFTIQRIERTFLRLDQYSDPANNAVYTTGIDSYESREKLDQGTRAKTRRFDLPRGSEVFRLADSTLSTVLLSEQDRLIPLLYAATGVVKLSETAQLSGKAREIAMKRMTAAANRYRRDLEVLIKDFGGVVEWATLVTMDIEEIVATFDFYERLEGRGMMTPEEFMEMSRKLAGLKPNPSLILEEKLEPPAPVIAGQVPADAGDDAEVEDEGDENA